MDWQVADVTARRPEPGSVDLVLISYLHLPAADLALGCWPPDATP